jgi:hypothetical protein
MERDMVVTRHKSDIVVYDNFLTPEECAAIIKVLDIKMQKEDKITPIISPMRLNFIALILKYPLIPNSK